MPLRFTGSDFVPMDDLTFMWIQVTHFEADLPGDDRAILTALIQSPEYAHDYATPFAPGTVVTEPAVHGRWWRSRIDANLFRTCAAEDAEAAIRSWADDQDWTDPEFRQPPAVHQRLEGVFSLLRSGDVYQLQNPSAEAEHEYGWVTGNGGFHEFVVIAREARTVHLIVASDD